MLPSDTLSTMEPCQQTLLSVLLGFYRILHAIHQVISPDWIVVQCPTCSPCSVFRHGPETTSDKRAGCLLTVGPVRTLFVQSRAPIRTLPLRQVRNLGAEGVQRNLQCMPTAFVRLDLPVGPSLQFNILLWANCHPGGATESAACRSPCRSFSLPPFPRRRDKLGVLVQRAPADEAHYSLGSSYPGERETLHTGQLRLQLFAASSCRAPVSQTPLSELAESSSPVQTPGLSRRQTARSSTSLTRTPGARCKLTDGRRDHEQLSVAVPQPWQQRGKATGARTTKDRKAPAHERPALQASKQQRRSRPPSQEEK